MQTIKEYAFLRYWRMVNAILFFIGQEPAEYGEVCRARELSHNPDDAVYFITTARAEN